MTDISDIYCPTCNKSFLDKECTYLSIKPTESDQVNSVEIDVNKTEKPWIKFINRKPAVDQEVEGIQLLIASDNRYIESQIYKGKFKRCDEYGHAILDITEIKGEPLTVPPGMNAEKKGFYIWRPAQNPDTEKTSTLKKPWIKPEISEVNIDQSSRDNSAQVEELSEFHKSIKEGGTPLDKLKLCRAEATLAIGKTIYDLIPQVFSNDQDSTRTENYCLHQGEGIDSMPMANLENPDSWSETVREDRTDEIIENHIPDATKMVDECEHEDDEDKQPPECKENEHYWTSAIYRYKEKDYHTGDMYCIKCGTIQSSFKNYHRSQSQIAIEKVIEAFNKGVYEIFAQKRLSVVDRELWSTIHQAFCMVLEKLKELNQ